MRNIKNKNSIIVLCLCLLTFQYAKSQDINDLLQEMEESSINYIQATFKSTRIITGHSIENMKKGQLDFRVAHRFGTLNSGSYNLWGLDEANIHFGFDLGLTDRLMIGVGRGTYEKTFDGLMKFAFLKQSTGEKEMPLSVSWLGTMAMATIDWYKPGKEYLLDRLSYSHQILIARKFTERLSLELNPSFVHRNLVATELDPNDVFFPA